MLPLTSRLPASELIVAADPRSTAPCHSLLLAMFCNAPALFSPVPFKVSASRPTVIPVSRAKVPPLLTVVALLVVTEGTGIFDLEDPVIDRRGPVIGIVVG